MKVLVTGANGYIGMRLIPKLIEAGHEVVACVRSKTRFLYKTPFEINFEICEIDFLELNTESSFPKDIDVAFYLIHSMSSKGEDFEKLETKAATNFVKLLDETKCKQLVYLSGLSHGDKLSKHFRSRNKVGEVLKTSKSAYTIFQSGIIVGSGNASFEIVRDLVEKLPVMLAPKWLNTDSQPIAIRNVIYYLTEAVGQSEMYDQTYEIGGPEVLTYKEMLLQFAEVRDLKRFIWTVPVMTPRLSSYWLFFVTSTSYPLAVNLVNSMKIGVKVEDDQIKKIIPQTLIPYKKAVEQAFLKIEQNEVVSSWKDALVSSSRLGNLQDFVEVPQYGVFKDYKKRRIENDVEQVKKNIFSVGGNRGWYYGTRLWEMRGHLDKLIGGVGLRRGRTSPEKIQEGDALDFWRVLIANENKGRLLLYAEMKLPGEAWLEFNISKEGDKYFLEQEATFRPSGILGRLYWYAVFPFHAFVFTGMNRNMEKFQNSNLL